MIFTAKTLDELLDMAANQFEVEPASLKYTITEEKKGVLGIGASVTADVEVPQVEAEPAEETEAEETLRENVPLDYEEVKEFLFDYLGDFFVGIDLDMEVAIEERQGTFIVNLNAENNAVLIGQHGKTLASLNTVVRSAVNARFRRRIDVLIDVNHYKEDRYHKVTAMARRIAKQVQQSHITAELDPMSSDERKAIHKALGEWHNIRTESRGDGSKRHICIVYVESETE